MMTKLRTAVALLICLALAAVPMLRAQSVAIAPPNYFVTTTSTFFVSTNFVTANNTTLQTITGLTFTLPSNTALTVPIHCSLAYSQATANAAVAFGIQSATISPTSIQAQGVEQTAVTAFTGGQVTITNTTATNIVSATPAATATNFVVTLDGLIQNPSNASTNAINILTSTAAGADAVTVLAGSFCRIF